MPHWTGIAAFRPLCSRVAVLGGPVALCAAALVVLPAASASASAGDAAAPARSGGTAAAADAGGAVAPDRSGGTQVGALIGKGAPAARPVARTFKVPRVVAHGAAPRIAVRIDAPGVPSVQARVVILRLGSNAAALRIDLGALPTGRKVLVPWPKGTVLAAGQYLVRLHAKDAAGRTLQRKAHTSGKATLTVRRAKRAPMSPAPAAPAPPAPSSPAAPVVAPLSTAGAVFPVQGPHTYGGEGALFGAGRTGHIHEGQDVVAAEGTPIVAPLPGIITFRAYQASAAGYYLVQRASDGHDFFFAHCQKDSFGVDVGATVAAGQQICRMGSTGDASGPHLHFEAWEGGWRVNKDSKPIDPLPLLQAWDQG